jgi:hypothetical protein
LPTKHLGTRCCFVYRCLHLQEVLGSPHDHDSSDVDEHQLKKWHIDHCKLQSHNCLNNLYQWYLAYLNEELDFLLDFLVRSSCSRHYRIDWQGSLEIPHL